MSRALVTGSSGFLGRRFAARLREDGWDVTGIDTGPGPGSVFCDARDWFRGYAGGGAFDLAIHCAAVVGGRAVIERSPLDQAVNYELDAGLFRWARTARPGRIVYISSSAAYPVALQDGTVRPGTPLPWGMAGPGGDPRRLRENDINLDDPRVPDGLYGRVKLAGEHLASLARREGLAVTVIRPFSGYGPDQDDSYPFPAFTDRALRREDPFTVWGGGSQVRDWVHADDIVATVMEMYRLDENGPVSIGWGTGVSMDELARRVCGLAGYEPAFEHVPAAPSGVAWRVCNPGQLYRIRAPRISLDDGIAEALEYRKRYLK